MAKYRIGQDGVSRMEWLGWNIEVPTNSALALSVGTSVGSPTDCSEGPNTNPGSGLLGLRGWPFGLQVFGPLVIEFGAHGGRAPRTVPAHYENRLLDKKPPPHMRA